jgi:type I restriction enzyme S subunit
MNADRLLALYDRVSEAHDAIACLRRFVLDLAVRGNLVEQDPSEESASELLKRITAEKAQVAKAGVIRKPSHVEIANGCHYELPGTWAWVPLAEIIIRHVGGGTPSKNNSDYWDGDLPWASVKDIGKSKYLDDTVDRITEAGLANSSSNLIEPGQLIVVTRMGLGKVSINRIPVAINQDLRALYLSTLISIDYAYNFFLTYGFEGTGLTVKGVKLQELLRIPFPLPPIAEQRRIVAKVDKLMALCDRLEMIRTAREATRDRLTTASLARLTAPSTDTKTFRTHAGFALDAFSALTTRPDQIKTLRQTILNLAVRGKLVEQNPTDEPAAKQLSRIEAARLAARGQSKNSRSNRDQVDFEGGMPNGWAMVRLADVAVTMRYGTSIKCNYDRSGTRVLRIPNISSGKISLNDLKFGLLKDKDQKELALEIDDLLMIRSNGSLDIVGRSAVVTTEAAGMSFAGYLVRLRSKPNEIDARYIWLALNSTQVREQIEKPIRSTVGLKNVNLTEFGNLQFWLPPVAEQHRIVTTVNALIALCDRLEASLVEANATRCRLLKALLHESLLHVALSSSKALEAAG